MDEDTDSNMGDEQPPPEREEGCKKCFHLFNCDKTYKLDVVEKLLNAIKDRHNLDISIPTKKYFPLFEMTELSKTIQSGPPMDFAIFVVHAHESRLSINEENAGIGYARFYRALLEKTDNRVIVVIGGDDNYRNAAEERKAVLSRWAKRQISSQFKEEFMDGRISFIFSWNKGHRPIHEEAVLHFLDPGKKGEKFEPKSETIQAVTSNESAEVDEKTETPTDYSNVEPVKDVSTEEEKAQTECSHENDLVNHLATAGDRIENADPMEVSPEDTSGHDAGETPESAFNETLVNDTPLEEKKTAFFCRDQCDATIISDLFGEEVLSNFHIFSGEPDAWPESLLHVRSCFIVVNANTMNDELNNKSAGTPYKDLLIKATETVEKRVAIIICSDKGKGPQYREDALTDEISLLLGAKAVILWWKGDKNVPHQTQNPRPTKPSFLRSQSVPDDGAAEGSMGPEAPPLDPQKFTLLLKTRLCRGKISYEKKHVKHQQEGWRAPDYIADDLMAKNPIDADLQVYQENSTNRYRVVVNGRRGSNVANKIANSLTGAIDTLGELWSSHTELENVFYYPHF